MPLQQGAQPLYHRVYREIAEGIESGVLQPGDRLPSERALCEQLGVSRATVRRAVEELISDGLVETRGRGSFVRGDAVVEPPNTLMSLSEVARAARARRQLPRAARRTSGRRRSTRPRPSAIAPGADLFELERVRMLDGLPISLDQNRVPLRLLPGAAAIDFAARVALRRARATRGIRPSARTTSSRRAPPRAHEAELLGLAPDAPVLFATTVAIGDDGRVVDLGRTVYRADRYRFQATLMRRAHRYGGRQ